jgi:hypothetical protein
VAAEGHVYACLVRLSAKLSHREALQRFWPRFSSSVLPQCSGNERFSPFLLGEYLAAVLKATVLEAHDAT